jgi:hypothetical protein
MMPHFFSRENNIVTQYVQGHIMDWRQAFFFSDEVHIVALGTTCDTILVQLLIIHY